MAVNALFVLLALQAVGGTAAELSDSERSTNQTFTAVKLDIAPGATAATDLNLSYSNVTAASQTQTFTVSNTASPTTNADIYLWLVPDAGFPFCPTTGLRPVLVTIKDHTGTDQTVNVCDLRPGGSSAPFKIADDVAGGTTVTRDVIIGVHPDTSPTVWNFANGTGAIKLFGTQENAPGPVLP